MKVDFTKYNTAARICNHVFNLLKRKIENNEVLDIKTLYDIGMKEIEVVCNNAYKKIERKGVAYPISINLNNCVDHYIPDLDYKKEQNSVIKEQNSIIKDNDIVKIKLGVDIDGCIAMYCNTFIYTKNNNVIGENLTISKNEHIKQSEYYIDFLNRLQNDITKQMFSGNTNDELKILIESKCTEYNLFPLINCKSYEHTGNQIYNNDGKYMILNYKRLYDKDDYLLVDNECFEFLEDEVYTININVVPEDMNDDNNIDKCKENYTDVYTDEDNSRIYRLNDLFYSFKLKASKNFFSTVYKKHHYNAFNISEYTYDMNMKFGMKECKRSNVLQNLPLMYTKNKNTVYSISFTVVVRKDCGYMLKYK